MLFINRQIFSIRILTIKANKQIIYIHILRVRTVFRHKHVWFSNSGCGEGISGEEPCPSGQDTGSMAC